MIYGILERRNQELLKDIEHLLHLIKNAWVPKELNEYKLRIRQVCEITRITILQNIQTIKLNREEILDDILSNTQHATRTIRLISESFLPPILRAKPVDRISLMILNWLHQAHPETETAPLAISDGGVAVWPLTADIPTFPTIYFFPSLERLGLLYQPLLFHEFGHVLYAFHRPEMDVLVAALQRDITDILMPASQRNDSYALYQASRRQLIINTWYSWTQELFCDTVGLTIGGPSFLYAFSTFLSTINRGEFYRSQKDLERSDHPMAWLRVQFLAERARLSGFSQIADSLEAEWLAFATTMRIREDYFGFYNQSIESIINRTIEYMLEETAPQHYKEEDMTPNSWNSNDSLARLLNWAWLVKQNSPQRYSKWETSQINKLIS